MFHPDHENWEAAGFGSWEHAAGWIEAGFKVTDAVAWESAGVEPREAAQWCDLVRTDWDVPLPARYVISIATGYRKIGFTPERAHHWTRVLAGLAPGTVGWCEANGITPTEVHALIDSDRNDVRSALADVDRTDIDAVFRCIRSLLTPRRHPGTTGPDEHPTTAGI